MSTAGSAVVGAVAYVPCQTGVMAVQTSASPPALGVQWKTPTGAGGPPIVAGGLIWTISQSGILYGLNPVNGQAVEQFALGSEANHFPTPSAGDGLLLAASCNAVHAFATPPPAVIGVAATADGGRLLAGGHRRRGLQLWRLRIPRLDGWSTPERPGGRYRLDPRWRRVLAGGQRWWRLRLR